MRLCVHMNVHAQHCSNPSELSEGEREIDHKANPECARAWMHAYN